MDKEVQEAMDKWFSNQPKTMFLEGLSKLVNRWTECIEKGDYRNKLKNTRVRISFDYTLYIYSVI